jgi:uncharacterized protein
MPDDVTDNKAENRYELRIGDAVAIAAYEPHGGALTFTHTEVPQELEGQGIATRLIAAALADVRRQGLKVIPLCSFVAAHFDKHPEEQDLLATDAPG